MVPAHRLHPRRCAVGVGEFPFGDGGLDDIADGVHPMRKVDGGVEVSFMPPADWWVLGDLVREG